ncbi:MAG: hypothetical protein WDZ59_07100 [Pirellulales bacterium]
MKNQISQHSLSLVCVAAIVLLAPNAALAAGGTSIVATEGQAAHVSKAWPEGVAELVNDPVRTTGWNSWFTEWPNDVNQYAMEIKSTDDLNRLIRKLAAVESDLLQIRLSDLAEPKGLGWVTSVPEGNDIPVIFSIGDQERIDQWYAHVRQPFGVMEFVAAPVAVPPTLTLFVQNEAVKLDELEIPEGISVTFGYVPTVFHKSNTTLEQAREEEAAKQEEKAAIALDVKGLDEAKLQAFVAIQAFLKTRDKETAAATPTDDE